MATDVFQVLGEDKELEQALATVWTWYWGGWIPLGPCIFALMYFQCWPLANLLTELLTLLGIALVALLFLRPLSRCELVLDTERQELFLRYTRLFFFKSYKRLAGAEELWGVTWAGELPQAPFTLWWQYVSLIITRQGHRFRSMRVDRESGPAREDAMGLADLLGVPYHEGEEERILRVKGRGEQLFLKRSSVPVTRIDAALLIYWGLMFFPYTGLLFYGLHKLGTFGH